VTKFAKTGLEEEYSVTNSHFFGRKNPKKKKKLQNLPQTCIQQEMVLKMFLLSYFEYHQIWLNILMDDIRHLSKITKLQKEKKNTVQSY
jgi:hypothetical protein